MPRGSNPLKVQLWTERLERFAQSSQTVVQFCQAERARAAVVLPMEKEAGPTCQAGVFRFEIRTVRLSGRRINVAQAFRDDHSTWQRRRD